MSAPLPCATVLAMRETRELAGAEAKRMHALTELGSLAYFTLRSYLQL